MSVINRRQFLELGSCIAALLGFSAISSPRKAIAAPAPRRVPAGDFPRALAAELGSTLHVPTDRINLEVPPIAEDGAIVPISIDTELPGIRELVVLVEKNPNPLVARFKLGPDADPYVSVRLKMNDTGGVVVLAKTADTTYSTRKTVKVLVGGCG